MAELIVSQIVNGLVLGFLYVLIAIGLSIIFGMLGVVNFAHGVFFALGAYFALSLRDTVGPWAIVLAPIFVGAAGMLIESSLLRPLYSKEPLLGLFMTFGIALFLEELIRTVWGAGGLPFDPPGMLSGFIIWGPVLVTKYRLFVLVLTAAILFALWLFLQRTRYGRIIRAGSRDAEMVSMLGINLPRVFSPSYSAWERRWPVRPAFWPRRCGASCRRWQKGRSCRRSSLSPSPGSAASAAPLSADCWSESRWR
jgi:branched-chain amino acid transport system permease protein